MKKYWKSLALLALAPLAALFVPVPNFAGEITAAFLFFAVYWFIPEKWGHLTMAQIAPRKTFIIIGIVGGVIAAFASIPWFESQSFFQSLILSLLMYFGMTLAIVGSGVAMMRDE